MKKSKTSKKIIYISVFFSIIGFIFCMAAGYPGITSSDSLDQYNQAKIGVYSNWHPPIMSWVWNKLLWVGDGPLPMLLVNNLLYWIGVSIIAIKLNRLGFSLVFLILSFSPPLINFIVLIWKDAFLFSLLFFVCAVIFSVYNNQLSNIKRLFLFLLIIVLSFVALMIRYNAASAIAPILGLSVYALFNNIKPLNTFIIGFAITVVLYFGGQRANNYLCNNKSQHPEQQLMLYDLLGISKQANTNLFPNFLKSKVTLDTINRIYNYCDGGMYLIFSMHCVSENTEELQSIKNAWKDAIYKYPKFALQHKYLTFICLQNSPLDVKYSYIDPKAFDTNITKQNLFRNYYKDYNESELAHKFYVPNYYFISSLLSIIISIIAFWKTKKPAFLLPLYLGLSGFLYSGSYFLLSPCNELRYNYWTIGATFLSVFFLLNSFLNKSFKNNN